MAGVYLCAQGEAAKNQVAQNPENTIYDIKRLIGRAFSEPLVKKDIKSFPFTVKDKGGKPAVHIKYQVRCPSSSPHQID